MPTPKRSELHPGLRVQIVEKQNQRTGKLTAGIVARILTSSPNHPHGIKVMLEGGKVGRVQAILPDEAPRTDTEVSSDKYLPPRNQDDDPSRNL